MRIITILACMAILIAMPVSAGTFEDLTSSANTGTISMDREFHLRIDATDAQYIYIDFEGLRPSWSEFGTAQSVTSQSWSYTECVESQEMVSNGQWRRALFNTENVDWSWTWEVTGTHSLTVQRRHALFGLTSDYAQMPAEPYITHTTDVPFDQEIDSFCQTALAGQTIPNIVKGYEGVLQRLHVWTLVNRPGGCSTAASIISGARGMTIPSCSVVAHVVSTTAPVIYPTGAGNLSRTFPAGPHMLLGLYHESLGRFRTADKAMTSNGFAPTNIVFLGYFDDRSIYTTYLWSPDPTVSGSISRSEKNLSCSDSQSYTLDKTRVVADGLSARLLTEKVVSSFKPNPGIDPGGGTVGVGDDVPEPAFGLVLYQNPIRGGRSTLEFGVHGTGNLGTVELMDVTGRRVWGSDGEMNLDYNMVQLPQLASGTYFVRVSVRDQEKPFTEKITILR